MKRYFAVCLLIPLIFTLSGLAQTDPQGVLDSFYVECPRPGGDTLIIPIRFFSDNTDSNKIAAFGLPILITINDTSVLTLKALDTTVNSVFAGSLVSGFVIKITNTDSCCGGNDEPNKSPVHFIMGAVNFTGGVTGDSLFTDLRLLVEGNIYLTSICIDTLSTATLKPSVVTEAGREYTPGWHFQNNLICFYYCPTDAVRDLREDVAGRPTSFRLNQNIPNPFNSSTMIEFDIPRSSYVKLEIFDILGRKVKTLVDENLAVGYKQVVWDGKNENGDKVASGIYFYRIKAADYLATKKMVLLK